MSKHIRPGIGKTLLLARYVWWQLKAGLAFHFGRSIKRIITYVRTLSSNNPGRRTGQALPHSDPTADRSTHHNIAPSQKVLTIRFNPETQQRSLDALQWGLIPYWAKDPKIAYRTINARAETIDKAPSYRQAFKKRRCLIPADGFYEWRKTAKPKLPFA